MTFFTDVQSDFDAIVAAEIGTQVTYRPSGQIDRAVTCVFREDDSNIERRRGARAHVRTATALVSKSDLAAPTLRDKVLLDGEVWNVTNWDPQTASWNLSLTLSSRVDRTTTAVVWNE